jgi:xylulokinase
VNDIRKAAVLGIDLGTSGVKAIVVGGAGQVPSRVPGQVLGRGMAGYPVRVPAPGHAESAPEDWWLAMRAAVREALTGADRVTVTALAVAGQMRGLVLVDERGAPLRPAILGLDKRAAAEAATFAELPGEYGAVLSGRPLPGMGGPLLSWLVTHEPCTVRAAWWALQPRDWLRLRLTGQVATDPADASGTLLFDQAKNAWADPVIEKLGLPREKLPPVRDSAGPAGPLLPGPAADLGLHRGIPVAVGAAWLTQAGAARLAAASYSASSSSASSSSESR